jgi:hypothetical protein
VGEQANHIDAAIADLQVWMERISTAIETLRTLRAYGDALPAGLPPTAGQSAKTTEIPHDAFFQMTVPDAADKYLRLMKTTKPSAELAAALLKGGLKSTSQNFQEMIRSILSRDDRFVRVNTEWGLAEWYTAMRKRTGERRSEGIPAKKDESAKRVNSEAFTQTSMKGRTLAIFEAHPEQRLNALSVAEQLGETNVHSIRAVLSALFTAGYLIRPKAGFYQFKKQASA